MILVFVWALLVAVSHSSIVNLTDYWQKQLNRSKPLGYHAYAGYEPLDWYLDGKLFYTLWTKQGTSFNDTTVPLVIFLEGGPGAASQWAAFNYIGPIQIVGKESQMHIQEFEYGWNQYCHLLVVDQPINVGFSYDKLNTTLTTSEQAAAHFMNFLDNFFNTWGGRDRPIYITGESYAGHYVPVFTQALLRNQTALGLTNIKGISIGGAYINSYVQDNQFDAFLQSHGVTDRQGAETTQYHITQGMLMFKQGKYVEGMQILNSVFQNQTYIDLYFGGVNLFNVRQFGEGNNTNYDYDQYLNKIKDDLGVPKAIQYIDTNNHIYQAFSEDLGRSKEDALLYCLDNIRVLLYVGQNDAVVSPPGLMNFVNGIGWRFRPDWARQDKQILRMGDKVFGWIKRFSRLSLAVINNAGHFVPADQPSAFRQLFLGWLA